MKKLFYFLLAAVVMVACNPDNPDGGAIQSVSITKSVLELTEGAQQRLTLDVTPTGAEYTAVWSSEDEKIATVSNKGIVTANSVGETTINVAIDGTDLKASCRVVVKSMMDATIFDFLTLYNFSEPYVFKYTTKEGVDTSLTAIDAYFLMLPSTMYIDGEGYLAGEPGYMMEIRTAFEVAVNDVGEFTAMYALADYTFVDNALNDYDQFYPWTIQVGHFDEKLYAEYWTSWILYQNEAIEEEPVIDNYPYFDRNDSYMCKGFSVSTGIAKMEAGYPTIAEGREETAIIQMRQNAEKKLYPSYYDFDVVLFGDGDQFGLALEERTDSTTGKVGLYYMDTNEDNLFDMAPFVNHTFTYGTYDDATEGVSFDEKVATAQAVPAAPIIKQAHVVRTLNIPLLMKVNIK